MARLVLGPAPALRGGGRRDDLGRDRRGRARSRCSAAASATFHVEGHHYALVHCTGLRAGRDDAVRGAARRRAGLARARTRRIRRASSARSARGEPFRIAWGSCRVCAPHEPPYSLRKDEHPDGREVDALRVLADHMCRDDAARVAARARAARRPGLRRRGRRPRCASTSARRATPTVPPGETVANFEEYTRLYRESWSEPHIRWLLSTVPVGDDLRRPRRPRRLEHVEDVGRRRCARPAGGTSASSAASRRTGSTSTWATSSPRAPRRGRRSTRSCARPTTAGRSCASSRSAPTARWPGTRWSYCRDFGRTRLMMIDSRAGRVLDPPEDRSMLDPHEWEWLEEHADGRLRPPADRHVAAVPARARAALPGGVERGGLQRRLGRAGARSLGEQMRQALDLEHWAAFGSSLDARRASWCATSAPGEAARRRRRSSRCRATCTTPTSPRSASRAAPGCARAVYQATCSPFRNPLDDARAALDPLRLQPARARWSASCSRAPPASATRRCAGASRTTRRSSTTRSASSSSTGGASRLWLQKTVPEENEGYSLETVFERVLA